MKNRIKEILLVIFFWSITVTAQTGEYPPDATIYNINTSTQGTNTSPSILQKSGAVPYGSVDVRIHPTTNSTQSEMSIAVSPVNNQILLASANASNYPVTTIYGTGYYISTDGGNTWSGSDIPPSGNGNHGDPAVAIDRNGYLYIGSIASNDGQGVMRSTDNGNTWNYYQVANPTTKLLDKNHLAVDNSLTSSYEGNLYSAWSDFAFPDTRITLARSVDKGVTWANPQVISSGFADSSLAHQGVNIQIGPNGNVYACWAVRYTTSPYTEVGIGFNKSNDGGQTWGNAHYAINNIKGMRQNPYPVLGIRTNSFPVMGVNQQTGRIYIAWVNIGVPGTNTGDPDVYLIYSDDNGSTWSTPKRVNNDQVGNNAIQFHCWLTVDPELGDIYVAYYDNRADIGTNNCEFYVSKSTDNGQSFTDFAVSDNSFSVGPLPGFGGNYNGEYPGIAARGGSFYPLWHSQVPAANAQGWVSPVLSTKVEQLLADGTTIIGTIGRWNGSSFNPRFNPPKSFYFDSGTQEVFHGDTQIYSNQKYHNWNNESDVTNHHTFTVTTYTTKLTSNFQPTYSGVSVKNSNEGTSNSSGTISFKDPWYRDYADPSYGNNVRNRGTDAIWHSKSSPFYITTSSDYQGVFLGQGSPNWSPPYYSVKATSPQTIYVQGKNRQFYFQNWEADQIGSATFQNSGSLETSVVFNSANATVKAVMKGTGLSDNSNAFASNNQRKIVKTDNGNLHRVYESLGKVWYEMSTDDGVTWSIMNNGEPLSSGEAKLPSISAKTGLNELIVVYQQKNGYHYDIVLECLGDLPRSTQTIYQEQTDLYSNDAFPLTSLGKYGHTIILWAKNINYPPVVSCLFYWNGFINGKGVTTYTTGQVPYTDYNSVKPSIVSNNNSEKHLVWQQNSSSGSSIKYIRMAFNSTTLGIDFSNYSEASSTTGYADNFDPSIAITLNRPRVAWLTENPITLIKEGNLRTKSSVGTSWGTLVRFSYGGGDNVESINVNARNTDYGYVVGYAGDGNEVRYYKPDGTNQAAQPVRYERYVQLSNGDDYNDMAIETFNTWSTPYYFKSTLVDATLSKTNSENNVIKGREVILSKEKSKILFEVSNINVDDYVIDFIDVEDTLLTRTKEEVIALFETKEFQLTDNSNFEFNVNYVLVSEEKLSEQFDLEFQLLDAKTNKTIGVLEKIEFSKIVANEANTISYKVETNDIGVNQVKLKLVLDEKLFDKIAIVKTYKTGVENLPKENRKEIAFDKSMAITDYSLSQNYPNPFNPRTTIKYQIPEDGFVSVKIYDITGREVTTLVNGAQTKGRYKVSFDASSLSSGVYLYRIQSGSFTKSMKMILLK